MNQAVTTPAAAAPSPEGTALTAPAAAPAAAAPAADGTAADGSAPAAAAPAGGAAPAGDAGSAAAPADGEKPEGGEKPAPRAPAEYADFTVPEGTAIPADVVAQVKALAKDMDLTQEQAQKLVDLNIKQDQTMANQLAEQGKQWLNELPSDKEFGGEKLSENLAIAKKAIDTFGTPELREILEKSRLGNHPEVIRAFYRAGKAISQDNRFVAGGSGAKPAKADAASSLYPNQKPA